MAPRQPSGTAQPARGPAGAAGKMHHTPQGISQRSAQSVQDQVVDVGPPVVEQLAQLDHKRQAKACEQDRFWPAQCRPKPGQQQTERHKEQDVLQVCDSIDLPREREQIDLFPTKLHLVCQPIPKRTRAGQMEDRRRIGGEDQHGQHRAGLLRPQPAAQAAKREGRRKQHGCQLIRQQTHRLQGIHLLRSSSPEEQPSLQQQEGRTGNKHRLDRRRKENSKTNHQASPSLQAQITQIKWQFPSDGERPHDQQDDHRQFFCAGPRTAGQVEQPLAHEEAGKAGRRPQRVEDEIVH